ncbi:hypothetical protein ACP5PY_03900 [Photobacterium leiognathi subsp. mandapamensis]
MMKETSASALPLIIAGPILRKATASQLVLWFVTTERLDATFYLYQQDESEPCYQAVIADEHQIQIGEKAWVVLAQFVGQFPINTPLSYQLVTQHGSLTELIPSLTYQNESAISFVIKTKADYVLHGSCRNPHYPSKDSLVAADSKVEGLEILDRPSLLMMSGDQIYADHVAGPTLDAIEQVVQLLGLPKETFEQACIADTDALYSHPHHFYGREKILPTYIDQTWLGKFIPNRVVPIFSSRECENHLISFSEYFAMYLLVWSPTLWQYVDRERFAKQHFICGGEQVALKWRQQWEKESVIMDDFIQGLPEVQRLFAHIPTYMIFDDHDITDDYQLNRRWEKAAFDNLFSRRIIGNALMSYWLCQAWGCP